MIRAVTIFVISVLFATAAAAQLKDGGVYECAGIPPFIAKKGIQSPYAFDTTVTKLPGLVIRELGGAKRVFQAKSWRVTGHVASTVRDRDGSIYVIPVPSIALDTNPLERRNRVYRVDAQTGEMSTFIDLPLPQENSQQNPFGTVGMALDCDTNSLYVSSVAGSTPAEQAGAVYQIDLATGEVLDVLKGIDVIGLGIFNYAGVKRLYYGEARSSNVYSLPLSKSGRFSRVAAPRYEASLLAVKNGDSTQAKKIRFASDPEHGHAMVISETEFSYRLHAETSRHFRDYYFRFDPELETWNFEIVQ